MRYGRLDNLRGITFISMFLYHALWDLVYLYDMNIEWYKSDGAYIWQQSICWTFILLSGFCQPMGKRKLQRGLLTFGGGAAVTLATLVFMPGNAAVFGVLTLLGSCMLLWVWLEKYLVKIPSAVGVWICLSFFILTREVNTGWIGFEKYRIVRLPDSIYRNMLTAYLGFPAADFSSTDYFSLIPWIFLFGTGFYVHLFLKKTGKMDFLKGKNIPGISWIGRNCLILYLLHQPVLYLLFTVFFSVFKI